MSDRRNEPTGKCVERGYWALLRFTDWLAYLVLASIAITVTVDVFCRYFLGFSTQVAEEVASLGLVALIFVSLPGAFADGAFLRVDALYTHLKGNMKTVFDGAFLSIALVVTLVYVIELIRLVDNSYGKQIRSDSTLGTPNYLPQIAMVFGLCVLVIALVAALLRTFKARPQVSESNV